MIRLEHYHQSITKEYAKKVPQRQVLVSNEVLRQVQVNARKMSNS